MLSKNKQTNEKMFNLSNKQSYVNFKKIKYLTPIVFARWQSKPQAVFFKGSCPFSEKSFLKWKSRFPQPF